ncbi:MAG: hypothetical protein WC928_02300 [Patescibacteria group bacterium]|jgi:hypothetical protein
MVLIIFKGTNGNGQLERYCVFIEDFKQLRRFDDDSKMVRFLANDHCDDIEGFTNEISPENEEAIKKEAGFTVTGRISDIELNTIINDIKRLVL